jgi:hypothetical protein
VAVAVRTLGRSDFIGFHPFFVWAKRERINEKAAASTGSTHSSKTPPSWLQNAVLTVCLDVA